MKRPFRKSYSEYRVCVRSMNLLFEARKDARPPSVSYSVRSRARQVVENSFCGRCVYSSATRLSLRL